MSLRPVDDVWEYDSNLQLVEMSATGSDTILTHIGTNPSGNVIRLRHLRNNAGEYQATLLRWLD